MRILITNDDGVYSPGIAALAQVASRFGETRIAKTVWTAFDGGMRGIDNILRGELEVASGSVATLTSLRLLDAQGALVERVKVGEAATLRFSTVDAKTARVFSRTHGAQTWTPLAIVDDGIRGSRVDLSSITTVAGLIDLRIELEDAAGSRVNWTQAPAFAVGNATAPPRRRAAR